MYFYRSLCDLGYRGLFLFSLWYQKIIAIKQSGTSILQKSQVQVVGPLFFRWADIKQTMNKKFSSLFNGFVWTRYFYVAESRGRKYIAIWEDWKLYYNLFIILLPLYRPVSVGLSLCLIIYLNQTLSDNGL